MLPRLNKNITTMSYKFANQASSSTNNVLSTPYSFITWNCNGLATRMRQMEQWNGFIRLIYDWNPDIICLQEVKLPAQSPIGAKRNDGQPREPGKIKDNEKSNFEEAHLISTRLKSDLPDYNYYFSLSDWRYSGQLFLIKNSIEIQKFRYNFELDKPPEYYAPEGRVIIAYFPEFIFMTTYSPNNGTDEIHFERRRKWDKLICNFFQTIKEEGKQIIWTGDLNCAPTDFDLSHPDFFRDNFPNLKDPNEFQKVYNIEDYCGYPGCTNAERARFGEILEKGHLVDVFRATYPPYSSAFPNSPHFTWRGHPGRHRAFFGKFYSRAMRLDHFVVSQSLLNSISKIQILGYDQTRVNFFGSDHCPVYLELSKGLSKDNPIVL